MKKSRLIIISLIALVIVVSAVMVIFHKPAINKSKTLRSTSVHKTSKKLRLDKAGSPSLSALAPGESVPPLSEVDRETVAKRVKPFPETLMGSGPPAIWADANQPANAAGAATISFQTLELKYPNGFELIREYRYPDDATINNFKARIEQDKENDASFYGGVTWQLIDINGHEALARENIKDDGVNGPGGANIEWYVKPFLYTLTGGSDMPLAKVIPAAQEITDFANKNIPQTLPPYAVTVPPYGYDESILRNQAGDNIQAPQPANGSPGLP